MRLRRHSVGFTLIEVLVVVAIIGILAGVGFPAYTEYVIRGKRAEGRNALLTSLQQMERFFAANNRYPQNAAEITATGFATTSGEDPAKSHYNVTYAACAGTAMTQCVQVSAAPRLADTGCGTLTITTSGIRGSSVAGAAARCWQR